MTCETESSRIFDMAITSYIGAPEDEPGYWDDKYPDNEEEDFDELEAQVYEAFKAHGWIIPTTEAEVAVTEESDIEW